MKPLAARKDSKDGPKDSKDGVIEVAGAVYHDTYTEGGDRTSTQIHDLDGLRNISWLDPETDEKIYKEYLAPKGNPYSGSSSRM